MTFSENSSLNKNIDVKIKYSVEYQKNKDFYSLKNIVYDISYKQDKNSEKETIYEKYNLNVKR